MTPPAKSTVIVFVAEADGDDVGPDTPGAPDDAAPAAHAARHRAAAGPVAAARTCPRVRRLRVTAPIICVRVATGRAVPVARGSRATSDERPCHHGSFPSR